MRVLFYSPNHTGHHFAYLARMMPGFVRLPIEIMVATTPEAMESLEYSKSLLPFAGSLKMLPCCTPAPRHPVRNARHRLHELARAIRMTEPDHVMACYADGLWEQAVLSAMIGRRPWPRELAVEGWIYRGRFADSVDHRRKSKLRRWIYARLLRSGLFRRLHLDHELVYDFSVPLAADSPTEVVLTPNPILLKPQQPKENARRELGLPVDGTWISLSGVIARFKGAHLLLDAFQRYRRESGNAPIRLLLAGPHEREIQGMLQVAPYRELVAEGDIASLDRYLTEDEMFLAAAASDLVLAPYPNHQGRSSIILWAAAAGRPSLGTDESCIGYVIKRERLGITCNVEDTSVLAQAIAAALDMPWSDDDAQRVRQYAEFHRVENYQQVASALVRQRLETRLPIG
jgi:glycosyltransferase involved in cell wall biosynthesis